MFFKYLVVLIRLFYLLWWECYTVSSSPK